MYISAPGHTVDCMNSYEVYILTSFIHSAHELGLCGILGAYLLHMHKITFEGDITVF